MREHLDGRDKLESRTLNNKSTGINKNLLFDNRAQFKKHEALVKAIQCTPGGRIVYRYYNILVTGRAPDSDRALTADEVDRHVIAYLPAGLHIVSREAEQNGAYHLRVRYSNDAYIGDIRASFSSVPTTMSAEVSTQ